MSINPSTAPYRTAYVRGADGLFYKIGGSDTGGGPAPMALDDLTDVDTTWPVPAYGDYLMWYGSGWGPGHPQRTSTNTWTGTSIAPGVHVKGFGPYAASYRLYSISTDAPCRMRMYTTAAKRDADLNRPVETDPTVDHGLVFEFISTPTLLSSDLSPMVDGFTGSDGSVYYTITNTGVSTALITIDIAWIRTE